MFELRGKIKFDPINFTRKHNKQSSWKKVAMIQLDDDIYAYYSWFIEKRFGIKLNKPIRGTHFTIINDIIDNDVYLQAKDIFDGKDITFFIDPTNIKANSTGHWWIKVYSDDAQNIRNAMGLGEAYFGFHLTIGLATHENLEQSEYIRICQTEGFEMGNDILIKRLINKGFLNYKYGKFINK
jgi:hypothetical protein